MDRGYIKLWRKTLDSGILKNHKLWVFWSWCLMKASHKKHTHMVGFQEVELTPGQFVFGINKASKELAMSPQSIRTCVCTLVKTKNLTRKSTNRFSIITIVNWETYQQDDNSTNKQANKQVTSSQQASNNKQECKNGKNGKNKKNIGEKILTPPTQDEVINFFIENNYSESSAKKAYAYYHEGGWKDSRGQPVKNWKQKMRGVWFKDENKSKGNNHNGFSSKKYTSTPDEEIGW